MLRSSALILILLIVSTFIGLGLALSWPADGLGWVFWYCVQALPLLYVGLAWLARRLDPDLDSGSSVQESKS